MKATDAKTPPGSRNDLVFTLLMALLL